MTAPDLLTALMPVIEALEADIVGLLRARAGQLDLDYLKHWASTLGVADLLERASGQAS